MTITEHLEFSILTAPLAAVDRRTLSQAWYSALYAQASPTNAASPPPAVRTDPAGAEPRSEHDGRAARGTVHDSEPRLRAAAGVSPRAGLPAVERRAVRSPLARKIERAFLRPHDVPQKATFALDGKRGRVQILLRQSGARVQLVAICPVKARGHVARALSEARYALAARGIALEARTQSASC